MAVKYKEEGYTGIIVTDHFFNGNTTVPRDLPWEERVELFCKGYENAKAKGDEIGLDVYTMALIFLCTVLTSSGL